MLPLELTQMIIWVMHHQADALRLLPAYRELRQQTTKPDDAGAKNQELNGAAEVLQDVDEWLRTGKVDGVGFDREQVSEIVKSAVRVVSDHPATQNARNTDPNLARSTIEAAISELRQVIVEPVSLKLWGDLDMEIRPALDDDRVLIGHRGRGFTLINYTQKGLILDVTSENEIEPFFTTTVFAEDLTASY